MSLFNDVEVKSRYISKILLINMVNMMIRQINKLSIKLVKTDWDNYYSNTNYDELFDTSKVKYVSDYLKDEVK